jgi:hypothetical protein
MAPRKLSDQQRRTASIDRELPVDRIGRDPHLMMPEPATRRWRKRVGDPPCCAVDQDVNRAERGLGRVKHTLRCFWFREIGFNGYSAAAPRFDPRQDICGVHRPVLAIPLRNRRVARVGNSPHKGASVNFPC